MESGSGSGASENQLCSLCGSDSYCMGRNGGQLPEPRPRCPRYRVVGGETSSLIHTGARLEQLLERVEWPDTPHLPLSKYKMSGGRHIIRKRIHD